MKRGQSFGTLLRGGAVALAGASVVAGSPGNATVNGAGPWVAGIAASQLLIKVEDQILNAYNTAYREKRFTPFEAVEGPLRGIDATSRQAAHYQKYWLGFLLYKKSIALMHWNQREAAEDALSEALNVLERIETPDPEVHALIGLAGGLNFQFVARKDIMEAISKTNKHLKKAIDQNGSLRGYYANAMSDWYTAEQYGGKQKAEDYLRKALSLPNDTGGLLGPSWGRAETMALLIQILQEKGKTSEATTLLAKAKDQYPGHIAITRLSN